MDTFANVQTATNFQQMGKNALIVDWVSVMTGKVFDRKFTRNAKSPFDKLTRGSGHDNFCTFHNFVSLNFG